MPKMKTKSGAKKRFKPTASGMLKAAQAGKRHGMIKRSKKFIRNARGTTTLSKACLLYTSPSPRDLSTSRMPSSA